MIEATVRDLIRARAPHVEILKAPLDGLRLGAGGLGLDSIAIVELLLDCGEHLGVPAPIELLEGGPLTVGGLVAHLRSRAGR